MEPDKINGANPPGPPTSPGAVDDSANVVEIVARARAVNRRRGRLWRSLGLVIISALIVIGAILWQRDAQNRRREVEPLKHAAEKLNANGVRVDELPRAWQTLRLTDRHVRLELQFGPRDDEPIPVACSVKPRHLLFSGTGRGALIWQDGKFSARWVDEATFQKWCEAAGAVFGEPLRIR